MLEICPVETAEDKKIWRGLFDEFIKYSKNNLPNYENLSSNNSEPKNPIEPKLIANYKGKDVGCVGLRKESDEVCVILGFYVKEKFRGNGVGKALAQRLINYAREMGFHYVRLGTYKVPAFDRAIKLYNALGFKEIAPYEELPKELESLAVCMELKLV